MRSLSFAFYGFRFAVFLFLAYRLPFPFSASFPLLFPKRISRHSSPCRARPCVNSWFPCCLCAGDAISTCGECTISRANTIVPYKEPPSGGAAQQMPSLSIALLTAWNTVRINVGAYVCTECFLAQPKPDYQAHVIVMNLSKMASWSLC